MKIIDSGQNDNSESEQNIPKKRKKMGKKQDSVKCDEAIKGMSNGNLKNDTAKQVSSMLNDDSSVNNKRNLKRKRKSSLSDSKDVTHTKKSNMKNVDNDKSLNGSKAIENAEPEQKSNGSANSHFSNTEENDNEEVSKDVTATELEQFTGEYLKTSIKSGNGLDVLRKFLVICKVNQERDIAAEYLLAGGNILEILKLLDGTEKKRNSEAAIVFAAVNILIMKILSHYPQYQRSAEDGCRHVINMHMSTLYSLLSVQSTAKRRKIALRLLTALVSLGGTLPRELLAHLNLQMQTIENLVQHTKPRDPENVRTCFIHFLLAFLVEKSTPVIRALLDKQGLLSSIFPGLLYDSREVLNLVLATLQNCILENMAVSKTAKLHLFSTPAVQSLVSLYNWKGPTNWNSGSKKAKYSTCISNEYIEDKEIVTGIVHDFLIVLLTSHRYGIVFHDRSLGSSRTTHNKLVLSVLQSLEKPWEHEKPMQLVVKILAACPDLIKSHFLQIESYLQPRPSSKWLYLMKYIQKIIEVLDLEGYMKLCSHELQPSRLSHALIPLILPTMVIRDAIVESFNQSSLAVQQQAILVLIAMLEKANICFSIVKSQYSVNFTVFRNSILDYIAKNVPSLNMILKAWNAMIEPTEIESHPSTKPVTELSDVTEPTESEYFNTLLDLLHAYNEVCPQLLNVSVELNPVILLTGLNQLSVDNVSHLNLMKVKAIQFLLALNSTDFAPRKEMFSTSLTFLIFALRDESSIVSAKAANVIKMLFNICDLFEGCSEQMDIWINGFSKLSPDDMKETVKWFVDIVNNAWKHIDKYVNMVTKAEEMTIEETVVTARIEDIFQDLMTDEADNTRISKYIPMQQCTSIPPLLCCSIHKLKKDTSPVIFNYLSYVCTQTLYCQVKPESMLYLMKDLKDLPIYKNLLNWSVNEESKMFLKEEKIDPSQLFKGDITFTFLYEGKNITITHSLTPFEVLNCLRVIVFSMTQLAQKESLSEIQCENIKMMLVLLLNVAQSICEPLQIEACLTIIFAHPLVLHYFNTFYKKKYMVCEKIITTIFVTVCQAVAEMGDFSYLNQLLQPFKDKLIKHLSDVINKKSTSVKRANSQAVIMLLEFLPLDSTDIACLLKALMSLENNVFLVDDKSKLSLYSHIVPKLLEMSCSKKIVRNTNVLVTLDNDFVGKLFSLLIYMKTSSVDTAEWENAIYLYLFTFPHNIAAVKADIFDTLLKNKVLPSTVKLVSLLINRNEKLIPVFTRHAVKSYMTTDDVLPIMEGNLNYKWNKEFLSNLHTRCKDGIVAYLCQTGNSAGWVEGNVEATMYSITNTFDLCTCEKICNTVTQIGDKLEFVSVDYVRILQCLYNRYLTLTENHSVLLDLILILVHITTVTLKRESKNTVKLTALCEALKSNINTVKKNDKDFIFEALNTSHSWPQFTRFLLKFGLRELKNDLAHVPLLDTLGNFCDIAYSDESEHEYVKTLFEMTTSHSDFVNIMLSNTASKRDLIKLLSILVRKNKSVMSSKHIPLYLSAYNATLSEADQYILQILCYYEKQNIRLDGCRPYLWGSSAATHYSVKTGTDAAIWRHPSTSQVLDLFDKDMVSNTVRYYPIERTMNDSDIYANSQKIQASKIYDPAFYLPLLCHLLSENNVVACYKVSQTGALALVLSACCSLDAEVRMVAYTVISRYFFHLEASRSKEKLLWMRLLDALRHGIISLRTELKNVRLNCLVSTFLANTSLVASQPLNPLYSPLHTFLMAKVALDLNSVPEFLQLFHSSDTQYKVHRHWILKNIRDGIKTASDVHVVLKCVLYKILLDFYTCSLCDEMTRRLILEIIDATTKLPKASILLVSGYGLIPWLSEVVIQGEICGSGFIDLIISIVKNLHVALASSKAHDSYRHMLLKTLLSLRTYLATNPNETSFIEYVKVLRSMLSVKSLANAMRKNDLTDILDVSKKFLDSVDDCEYIIDHSCAYLQNPEEVKRDENLTTRRAMQSLVWTWCSQRDKRIRES